MEKNAWTKVLAMAVRRMDGGHGEEAKECRKRNADNREWNGQREGDKRQETRGQVIYVMEICCRSARSGLTHGVQQKNAVREETHTQKLNSFANSFAWLRVNFFYLFS